MLVGGGFRFNGLCGYLVAFDGNGGLDQLGFAVQRFEGNGKGCCSGFGAQHVAAAAGSYSGFDDAGVRGNDALDHAGYGYSVTA
ncbi:hypothetical protein D3C75_930940 [compost metagenome]